MKSQIYCSLLLATVLSASAISQETPATFQGTVQLGSETHRVVLHLPNPGPDAPKAVSFDGEFLPDYLPIDSLTQDASHVKLTFGGDGGTLEGSLSADGNSINGTLTLLGYGHRTAPLALHRVATEAAWPLPFRYQYHYKNITIDRPSPEEAKIPFSLRLAVDYMEQGASAWSNERQCVACHTNGSYMAVRPLMTAQLGPPPQQMHEFFVSALKDQLLPDPDDHRDPKIASTQVIYIALGLAIWDANVTHRLSPETAQALSLMFKLQLPSGDWFVDDDNNPPLESSPYQLATVAARAIANAPGWLSQQQGTPVAAQVELLKKFIRAGGKMQGDYDRTDLLWTASEYPGLLSEAQKQQLIDMTFAHQQTDGGWSIRTFAKPEEWGKGNRADKLKAEIEYHDPPSDGHMTGLAIIALRKAGIPASDPRIQRGVAWLLANQRSSGRWWTRSLNRDGWQFISYSSTVYPLLALDLCNALQANTLKTTSNPQSPHSPVGR